MQRSGSCCSLLDSLPRWRHLCRKHCGSIRSSSFARPPCTAWHQDPPVLDQWGDLLQARRIARLLLACMQATLLSGRMLLASSSKGCVQEHRGHQHRCRWCVL